MSGDVHVTGNTGIDALLAAEASLPPPSLRERGAPRIVVTCHRRESWGDGLASSRRRWSSSRAAARPRSTFSCYPNGHVARAMAELLDGHLDIELLAPCRHGELVGRMRDADLVLSDSGGIQEEAPALGTPLLVLRDKTERPEGLASGNALLVGTATQTIVRMARRLLDDPLARSAMARRSFPYGDGRAAPRIAAIIERWLDAGRLGRAAGL